MMLTYLVYRVRNRGFGSDLNTVINNAYFFAAFLVGFLSAFLADFFGVGFFASNFFPLEGFAAAANAACFFSNCFAQLSSPSIVSTRNDSA